MFPKKSRKKSIFSTIRCGFKRERKERNGEKERNQKENEREREENRKRETNRKCVMRLL